MKSFLRLTKLLPFILSKSAFALMKQKKHDFNRVLPFGDYFIDRFRKSEFLGFGAKSSIYDTSYVFGDVSIGEDCWVGPFTILDGSGGGLVIGNNCNISAGVQIYTHDTVDRVLHNKEISKAPVKIGDNVYIGPNTVISKGVTIGSNVVIGSNSFVNKDVPSYSKGWGTPFKISESEV